MSSSIEGGTGPIRFENREAIERSIRSDQGYDKIYIKETSVSGQKQWKIAVKTGSRLEAFKQASREVFSGKKEPVKYDSLSTRLAQYLRGDSSELFNQQAFKELAAKVPVKHEIIQQALVGVVDGGTRLFEYYKSLPFADRKELYYKLPKDLKNKALDFERPQLKKMKDDATAAARQANDYGYGRGDRYTGSSHKTARLQASGKALNEQYESRHREILKMIDDSLRK